jgi:hypothetical protein
MRYVFSYVFYKGYTIVLTLIILTYDILILDICTDKILVYHKIFIFLHTYQKGRSI